MQHNSYEKPPVVATPVVSAFGEEKSITAWARDKRCKVSAPAIRKRLAAGWKPEEAISKPATDRTTAKTRDGRVKPKRPKNFPLYAHSGGQWAKRIRGTIYYFGRWEDPQAARDAYLAQKDDLFAGRKPRQQESKGEPTVLDLCNRFMEHQEGKTESGELTKRSFVDYKRSCAFVLAQFGRNRILADLQQQDFAELRAKLAKGRSVSTLANEIGRIRVLLNFAIENEWISSPMKFRTAFRKPSKLAMRRFKQQQGEKLFEAAEIRLLLQKTSDQLRAMILLGINCGFGNHDCGKLPRHAVDAAAGWVRFPRPKTGIQRSVPLWPETIEAIQAIEATRPTPKDEADAELVFITKYGKPWTLDRSASPISAEFRKLLIDENLYRKGVGFYTLRHTFETIAGNSRDQVAVNHIMGHVDNSMAAIYRERIEEARLQAVVGHVHAWLYPVSQEAEAVADGGKKQG